MRTTLTQKKSSHKTSSNTTMMDPKIALIVSMGYSVGQAKQALAENNGDVDDAIDDLFLKGRLKARNITTTAAFNDDDVTVTDSLPPTNNSAGALFRPTPAIPLMAMRFANRNVQKNAPSNSPIQGRPIQENCKEDFDACPFPAKSALESDGAVSAVDRVSDNLGPDPIFKSLTPSAIPEDMASPEKSGFGTFDEKRGIAATFLKNLQNYLNDTKLPMSCMPLSLVRVHLRLLELLRTKIATLTKVPMNSLLCLVNTPLLILRQRWLILT
jgi:hypothetical protein